MCVTYCVIVLRPYGRALICAVSYLYCEWVFPGRFFFFFGLIKCLCWGDQSTASTNPSWINNVSSLLLFRWRSLKIRNVISCSQPRLSRDVDLQHGHQRIYYNVGDRSQCQEDVPGVQYVLHTYIVLYPYFPHVCTFRCSEVSNDALPTISTNFSLPTTNENGKSTLLG